MGFSIFALLAERISGGGGGGGEVKEGKMDAWWCFCNYIFFWKRNYRCLQNCSLAIIGKGCEGNIWFQVRNEQLLNFSDLL